MRIFKKCATCRKNKLSFLVKKAKVRLPTGAIANSRDEFCNSCRKILPSIL